MFEMFDMIHYVFQVFAFLFRDLKIVMVGDASVGKTCLVLRYIDRQFQESISVRC